MSLGSSLSGISFGGISSGLDTESIISRLMQLEALPIQRLQRQQAQLTQRQGLIGQFKSLLTSLATAAGSLNIASNFNPVTATSSDEAVAKVSAASGAVTGIYDLTVSKLAQAHKIASAAQSSASNALGMAGTLTVNGKGVKIVETDTLTTIAQKINAAAAGVSAGIIDGGANNAFLTLTATNSGTNAKVQIGDLDGTIAQTLGITSGSASLRETIPGGATSYALASASSALGSLLNATASGSQTFTLNGVDVSVNLDTASLQDVANAINTSASGASATVRSVTENGTTRYKLDITGLTTWADADGVLEGLGVVQRGYGNQLLAAQNAEYTLDGIALTSQSNTVTSAIPGVTLTLLKADLASPKTATLTLSKDVSAVKGRVREFADAYNRVFDFIKANSTFNKETFESGGLFGDSAVAQVEAALSSTLFNTPSGLTGSLQNLTQIGFSLTSEGKLSVDDSKLEQVINTNPDGLSALFRAMGTSANSRISYLASTTKTRPSGPAGYAVVISQAATKHTLLGEVAQVLPLQEQEILTFNGALFGNTSYDLILDAGMTQAQIVEKINGDAKLRDLVTATVSGGKLQIESKKFGTPGIMTVSSNRAGLPFSSGIGTPTVSVQGVNVEGTINGETATGSGQMLTGATGNANTEGLQLLYTGSATGSVGTLNFTKGIAAIFGDLVATFNDATNGLLSATDTSLTTQIDGLTTSINDLQARLTTKSQMLRLKFTKMEEAIARLQGQQQRLASIRTR